MRAPRIYFEQYGFYWSGNRKQFIAFLEHAIAGNEWNLSDFFKPLAGKPRFGADNQPLSWDAHQFELELQYQLSK